MFHENTTLDHIVYFFKAAQLELWVMAFCVALGTFWTRDYDDFEEINFFQRVLLFLGATKIPRLLQFATGVVGWGYIFLHFGSSTGRYYDNEIRTVIYAYAVLMAVPLDVWATILVNGIIPAMAKLVARTSGAAIDLIDATVSVAQHISRRLAAVGGKFTAFRDGVNLTSNALVFLSANTILLVGGASIGAGIGVTFFQTAWDVQTLNLLFHSATLVLFMASLMLVCVCTGSVFKNLDNAFGTNLNASYQAYLGPVQKPFFDVSSFVEKQVRDHQVRRNTARDAKEKLRRLAEKEAQWPRLVLVPLEPTSETHQPVRINTKFKKAAVSVSPVLLKRKAVAILSHQTDLFAEPWDGDTMTLSAHVKLTYPSRKRTHAVLLALAAHARRLENETE